MRPVSPGWPGASIRPPARCRRAVWAEALRGPVAKILRGDLIRAPLRMEPNAESLHHRRIGHSIAAARDGDSGDAQQRPADRGIALQEGAGDPGEQNRGEREDPMTTAQADQLRQMQSYSYLGVFVAQGLAVGITGPALPWIGQQLPADASLAPAFAARLIGGLLGSSGGGWALHCRVPGNVVLALGGLTAAAGVTGLRVSSSSAAVGCSLVLLDFGCGLVQVANTLTAWIQPEKKLMFWLNVLNGCFGVGTLLAPAVVAGLATLTGSHDSGVGLALTYLPVLAVGFCGATLFVPSPSQPTSTDGDVNNADGDARWVAIGLTCLALACVVGAETTFAAFLATYAAGQRAAGVLDVGHRQADLITSAFWLTFSVGRLGVGTLSSLLAGSQLVVLWAQLATLMAGIVLVLALPSSSIALWTGAILVGGGVAGLFAGFMAQLAARTPIDTKVGGLTGVAIMCGIAGWQSLAAYVNPVQAIWVVGMATAVAVTSQVAFQLVSSRTLLFVTENKAGENGEGSDSQMLLNIMGSNDDHSELPQTDSAAER